MRVLFALLLALPAAAEDYDPTEVLIRLRDRVLAHGERVPNHTCVETITRDRYEPTIQAVPKTCDDIVARRKSLAFPAMLRLATTDRLRLDVLLSGGRELLSWAGAGKFDDRELDELVPDGAIGTGPFAVMLLMVFRGRVPRFTFEGETTLDHRLVFEYSYRVPREESQYRVKSGAEWLPTGYVGTLWVDVKTAELARLAVRTDELEPASGSCETHTTLDYGTVQLGQFEYFLPKSTRQRFIGRDGGEAENRVEFASCREYRGESTVNFGGGIADLSRPRSEARASRVSFPPGLPVTIELMTTLHSTRAAAGDAIQGRLAKPIGDIVPAGAALEGRLMRVETRHGVSPNVVISLRWETIEIAGVKAPLSLSRSVASPTRRSPIAQRSAGGGSRSSFRRLAIRRTASTPSPGERWWSTRAPHRVDDRSMIPLGLAFLFAAVDPAAILTRVLTKIRADLRSVPNYTCVQTVTREFYVPAAPVKRNCDVLLEMKQNPTLDMKLHRSFTDRLRLEVVMAKTGELHAWVGATRFEEGPIDSVVRQGPAGHRHVRRLPLGHLRAGCSRLPLQAGAGGRWERPPGVLLRCPGRGKPLQGPHRQGLGDHGVPRDCRDRRKKNEELTRIWIQTAILPPAAGTCQSTSDLRVEPTQIGDGRFPLTSLARQRFVASNGEEALNTTRFRIAASIAVNRPSPSAGSSPRAARPPSPPRDASVDPGGLPFTMRLDPRSIPPSPPPGTNSPPARTAIVYRGRTLLRVALRVEGRLFRVEQHHSPKPGLCRAAAGMVEVRGARIALAGEP